MVGCGGIGSRAWMMNNLALEAERKGGLKGGKHIHRDES